MGTRKYFVEIYIKFGYAPSKRFSRPAIDTGSENLNTRYLIQTQPTQPHQYGLCPMVSEMLIA